MEPSDESLSLLARMAAKPGVQSTFILSRADGAILRADNISALQKRRRADSSSNTADALQEKSGRPHSLSVSNGDGDKEADKSSKSGEEVARIVWRFMKATEGTIEELDDEDEVRLLRVRTKKNEIVIVPSELHDMDGMIMLLISRKAPSSCLSLFTIHRPLEASMATFALQYQVSSLTTTTLG